MILLDTSGWIAAISRDDRAHRGARSAYENDPGPAIVSPFVLAELDYLLLQWAGGEDRA